MARLQRHPIPLNHIPKGVRLCYENCKRLFDDAVLLEREKRFSTSITNVILAQEELAKALILSRHYQSGSDVSKKDVGEIFRNHRLRLEEFSDYFFGIDSKLAKEDIAKFRLFSIFSKDTKEQHMYVDWSENGWSSPESSIQLIEKGGRDIKWVMHIAFLDACLKALTKDVNFQKVLNTDL